MYKKDNNMMEKTSFAKINYQYHPKIEFASEKK